MNQTFPLTFSPAPSSETIWLLVLSVLALVGVFFAFRYRNKGFSMMLFFVAVILGGSTVFSYLTQQRTGQVEIHADHLTTIYGDVPFESIRTVRIEYGKPSTGMMPQVITDQDRYLVIEMFGVERLTALPAQTYPIDSIKKAIDQSYAAWKQAQ